MTDDLSRLVGELKALLAKATSRPWMRDKCNVRNEDGDAVIADIFTDVESRNNARLIVALVNNAETLLDAAEERDMLLGHVQGDTDAAAASESAALRAENERLATELEELEQFIDETLPEFETDDGEHQELDRLRLRVAELEGALKPFADAGAAWPEGTREGDAFTLFLPPQQGEEFLPLPLTVRRGDYLRAAAVLKAGGDAG